MFIAQPFLTMHGPCGNHSDQPAVTAQREGDKPLELSGVEMPNPY